MTAIIITMILGFMGLGAIILSVKPGDKVAATDTKAIKSPLSTASKKILALYKTLPADSQNMHGLEASLRALDLKHGVEKVNEHFMTYEFPYIQEGKREFSWKPNVHGRGRLCHQWGCKLGEYYEIFEGLQGIAEDWAKQEKAFKIAGVQHDLDNLASIREAIRQERSIIQETTRKYT